MDAHTVFAMISDQRPESCETIPASGAWSPASNVADDERLLALAERLRAGDRYAFDALLELLTPRLLSIISRFVRNRVDAQDTLQEVAIQLFRSLPRFRGECRLTTFIYRVTLNVSMNVKKRVERGPLTFSDLSDADNEFGATLSAAADARPEHRLLSGERQRLLHAAIFTLNPQFRAVFVLADICGMKYDEIAEIMRSPIGAVRSRLHRARAALREKILASRELFDREE